MIILHGGWRDGWMLLWAEQSPDELCPEAKRHPTANEHPYCADTGELANVLASAVPGFRADSGRSGHRHRVAAQQGRQPPSVQRPGGGPAQIQGQAQAHALVHPGIPSVSGGRHPHIAGLQRAGDVDHRHRHRSGPGLLEPGGALRCGAGGSAAVSARDNPRRRWR